MSTLRLASRNLRRAPRRTVLTTIAVIAGVSVLLIGDGMVGGLSENIVATSINSQSGHVMVRPPEYPVQVGLHPVDTLLELNAASRALLEREAEAWTGRTYFAPTAAFGSDAIRVVAIGYDPERDPTVFPRDLWKVDGRLPDPKAREVAVSFRVARLLGLKPGDSLILQTRTHAGAMNALDVTVTARVSTNNPAADMLGVFVPGPLVQELVATDRASHVLVRLGSRDDAGAFAERLRGALAQGDSPVAVNALGQAEAAPPKVTTWVDETRELLELQQFRQKALNLVTFILLALAGFGIANTILMAAYERTREVGTLRSLGMTEGGVLKLFLFEGALVGLVGSLLGALLGGALVLHWSRNPIDLSAQLEQQGASLPVSALLYARFDAGMIAWAVGLGMLVATLASVYPARVASRMVPADAVRAS